MLTLADRKMRMIDRILSRPVAVSLLMLGIILAGLLGIRFMPVAALPQVEYPTLSVTANLPGASPEVVASTLTAPLERVLGSIAGVTEITSSSSQGRSRISMEFDLRRSIDAAARDVQAAINASLPLLPPGLPSLPTYRKVNPAEAPILIIAVNSEVLDRGQLYDAASTVLAQRLSQVSGVGQVDIAGGALPAVRVNVDPERLRAAGLGLEDVRRQLSRNSVQGPLGLIEDRERSWIIGADDQLRTAAEFRQMVLRSVGGSLLRLQDVATVTDAVQDVRHYGEANGKPAIVLVVFKQPNANVIETVERIRALLPDLQSQIAGSINLTVTLDRTVTIRASLLEVQRTLLISVGLVIAVALLFLRRARLALIPGLCVPVTLLGTCALMYLAGFSLDNLSLMALIMVTGFVVDDAIVVLENLTRHRERGLSMWQAARVGAGEIAPTVLSISLALIAVFMPVLFMGDVIGRLFRPFALILCGAVLLSMLVSLVLTPTVFARLPSGEALRASWRAGRFYRCSLAWCLRRPIWVMLVFGGVLVANVWLYGQLPKGFFPQQDTGRISGNIQGDQSTSFQFMQQRLKTVLEVLRADPAVAAVSGFTGGGQRNYASLFMVLKPLGERTDSSEVVIARLRKKLSQLPGSRVFLTPQQDLRRGARQSNSQFEYSLKSDDLTLLRPLEFPIRQALQKIPEITDVSSDQQNKALQSFLTVDRDALATYGITMSQFDNNLYDAFGQRLTGLIYNPLNQYRVVLELSPDYLQSPDSVQALWLPSADGSLVPLGTLARSSLTHAPLSVSHEAGNASLTFSFALSQGVALSQAIAAIQDAVVRVGIPSGVVAGFQGNAKSLGESERSQPFLILMTCVVVYLILGVLYESFLHPLTILSTLPAAGIGALLALYARGLEFTVIALIALILLMGIVMKNAILMIDFALVGQRKAGLSAAGAILRAAQKRLRPILMTTLAAMFGALPLAIITGDGAELRQPLGIAVVGGLLLSQLLTLYTTPVIFVLLERLRHRVTGRAVTLVAAGAASAALGGSLSGCANTQAPDLVAPISQAGQATQTNEFRNAPTDWIAMSDSTVSEAAKSAAQVQGVRATLADDKSGANRPATSDSGRYLQNPWWSVFEDPLINDLQRQVAQSNASLQASAAQVQAAQAAFEASRAALFPSFSLSGGVQRSVNNVANPRGTTFSVSGVVAPWELDLWGRLSAVSAVAQANSAATGFRHASAQLSMQAQVNQTVLTLRFAQTQQQLLERNEQIARQLLGLARNRIAAGVASPLEESQAQTQLSTIASQRVAAQAQARQLHNTMVTLAGGQFGGSSDVDVSSVLQESTGTKAMSASSGDPARVRDVGSTTTVSRPLVTPAVPVIPQLLPSRLIARRPDLQAAAATVNAAWAQREASRTALFPALTLSSSGGYRARGFSDLLEMPLKVWTVGASVAYPLFDGGARRAALRQNDALFESQVATWRQTVLDALQEVEDQLVAVSQYKQQADLQQQALVSSNRALQLTRNQYEAGLVSLQTLLQAQQIALAAEQANLLAQHQQRLAANVLLKNIAGGL